MKEVYGFVPEHDLLLVVDASDVHGGPRRVRGKGVPMDYVRGITRRADGVAVVRFSDDLPDAVIPGALEPVLADCIALPPTAATPAN